MGREYPYYRNDKERSRLLEINKRAWEVASGKKMTHHSPGIVFDEYGGYTFMDGCGGLSILFDPVDNIKHTNILFDRIGILKRGSTEPKAYKELENFVLGLIKIATDLPEAWTNEV